MNRLLRLMLLACFVLAALPQAFSQPADDVTLTGTLNFTIQLSSFQLPSTTSDSALASAFVLSFLSGNEIIGNLTLQLNLTNVSAGEFLLNLEENGIVVGIVSLNVSNVTANAAPVLTLLSLNWSAFTDVQTWAITLGNETANGTLTRNFILTLLQNGTSQGVLLATMTLDDFPEEGMFTVPIVFAGQQVGSIAITGNVDIIVSEAETVTNLFFGWVYTADGKLVKYGQVSTIASGTTVVTPINPIDGLYALVITGPLGTQVAFLVNGLFVQNVTLTNTTDWQNLNLTLPINSSELNFPDQDLDGVPDPQDSCPNSLSTTVNIHGCTCEQILPTCASGSCIVTVSSGPVCAPPAVPPPPEPCMPINTCVPGKQPNYCAVEGSLVKNCQTCGCPSDFACESNGECYKTIALNGLRCYINNYRYGKGLDCASLGPNFRDVGDVSGFFKVKVSGWAKPLNRKIKKKVESQIRAQRVCIDTFDTGCVLSDVKCVGEDQFSTYVDTIQAILQQQVNSEIKNALPSFLRWLGSKVKVKVDLSSLSASSIRLPYACGPVKITPDVSCKPLIQNGPLNQKADVVFVGDGFFTDEALATMVKKLIDYPGMQADTEQEGLFSKEPYASNKEKFNIWYVSAKNLIKHELDPKDPSWGPLPNIKDVHAVVNACPQRDYIVVVSPYNFRSKCGIGNTFAIPCMVSLASEPFPGRLLLHEFGHGFAALEDEYYAYKEQLDNPQSIEDFGPLANLGPNCKKDQAEATTAWGALAATGGTISYFPGCGGDCGKACAEFVRPTFNSVMNIQHCALGTTSFPCTQQPPFDPHYAVNDQEILKALAKFS